MFRSVVLIVVGCLGTASLVAGMPTQEVSREEGAKEESQELTVPPVLDENFSDYYLNVIQDDEQMRVYYSLLDWAQEVPQHATMLGVHVRRPSATLRSHLRIDDGMGMVVEQIVADSAAAEAGIQKEDVIVALDSQQLVNEEQLTTLVRNLAAGDVVQLQLFRQGEKRTVQVVLKQGQVEAAEAVDPYYSEWLLDKHPKMSVQFHHSKSTNCKACHMQ